MTLLLSEILTHYAAVFISLLKTYSSTLAVKQYLDELIRSDTHLLALSPSDASQPLLTHREVSQRALTKIQSDVDFLVSRLKQVRFLGKLNNFLFSTYPCTYSYKNILKLLAGPQYLKISPVRHFVVVCVH